MCGRYKLDQKWQRLFALYALSGSADRPSNSAATEGRFNIAPTVQVPVVRRGDDGREIVAMRWGLVPGWARDMKGPLLNNARADSVAEKPSFRTAFARRRCLIPADGYYEWETIGKQKLPWLYEVDEGAPFSFAGLWDSWQPKEQPAADPLLSTAIITTDANNLCAEVHDRMPVIVPEAAYAAWLDPATPPEALLALLVPFPAERMSARRVSARLNNSRNQGADLLVAD